MKPVIAIVSCYNQGEIIIMETLYCCHFKGLESFHYKRASY